MVVAAERTAGPYRMTSKRAGNGKGDGNGNGKGDGNGNGNGDGDGKGEAEGTMNVQRVVAVDWSGDKGPGQRKKIWAGVWTAGAGRVDSGGVRLEGGRTRVEVGEWLIERARKTPRMVVGFDFCFSFPEWFVKGEMGCGDAPAFWELVAREHGERWLGAECEDRRFWGRPGVTGNGKRPEEFSGERLHRMLRATDIDCKLAAEIPEAERAARIRGITPKSVFQIGGSGSVGTASLRGMPILLRLREVGFAVWPFDRPALKEDRPLVVEMYSRLNTGAVHKSNAEARAAYLLKKRKEDAAYAALPRGVMEKARGSEDAFDALVSCMVMTARRGEFAALKTPRDAAHRVEGWTWAPGIDRRRSASPFVEELGDVGGAHVAGVGELAVGLSVDDLATAVDH